MKSLATDTGTLADADDAHLVDLARTRNRAAIRILVQRNNLRLYRTARTILGDDAEAEDVVQETYLRAFTRLESFRGDSAFTTWLTRIALNEAYGRLRRRRPHREADHLPGDRSTERGSVIMFPTPPTSGPEATVARRQLGVLIERAVDALPEPFRIVFVLREIEEMSVDETARQIDLRPATTAQENSSVALSPTTCRRR